MLKSFVAACAIAGCGAISAGAATVVNGGLVNTAPLGNFQTLNGPNSLGVPGWVVGSLGSVDAINGHWQSADGDGYSVDLNGNNAGMLAQVVTGLQIGRDYVLKFALSGNPDGGPAEKQVNVGTIFNNGQVFSYDTALNGTTRADMKWVWAEYRFTAQSGDDEISFFSTTNGFYGAAIDAVSLELAPVPLPATLPLIGAGLGALALLRRRRH